MMKCPCCSNKNFSGCCESYLQAKKSPRTAEALMRSRYTAFTQADADYIGRTMTGTAAVGFEAEKTKAFASSVKWLGLTIVTKKKGNENDDVAWVKFIARYKVNSATSFIYENSEFKKIDDKWFYTSGERIQPGRNELCPCQSGKKYKRCCGA